MKLIDDWKRKWPRLWSVRLSLLAAAASVAEVAMNLWATGTAPILVLAAAAISLGAAIARIVAQQSLLDTPKPRRRQGNKS